MLSNNSTSTTCLSHPQQGYYDKPNSALLLEGESSRQNTNNASRAIPCVPKCRINTDVNQFSTDYPSGECNNVSLESVAFPRGPTFDLRAGGAFQEADAFPTRKRASASTSDIPPIERTSTFPRVKAELSHASLPSFENPSPSELRFIRKKSGEVVKPSLRARTKSAPTSPGPKVVHFDKQLEHVRLFRPRQTPRSISRDGSPTETSEGETSDGLSFPAPLRVLSSTLTSVPEDEPWAFDVRLESLVLDHLAHCLLGNVLVRNISFAKCIAARFTIDAWQTTSEVIARYVSSVRGGTYDRFEFRIRLADFRKGRIVLCVRYSVHGIELWDNNHGKNYEVKFDRAPRKLEVADLRTRLEKVVLDGDATPKKPRRPIWYGGGGDTDDTDDDAILPAPRIRSRPLSPAKYPLATTPLSTRYDLNKSLKHPAWKPPSPSPPAPRAHVPAGPARTLSSSTGLGSPRDSMEGRHHLRSVEREAWSLAKGSPVRRTPRSQYVPQVDDDASTPSVASTSASSSPSVSPVIPGHALPGISEGSKPHHALLDHFCFFAGESDPRCTSPGSSVEDYFSSSPPNAEFSSPTLAVAG